MINSKDIGVRTLDIQTGLYNYNDSLLDLKISETILIGKAASLASHLRGIQIVDDYEALKVLSSKLGISSTELVTVLDILQEVELIRVIGNTRNPERIEILISVFENAYQLLGDKWRDDKPNEFEQKLVEIVNNLAKNSLKQSKLQDMYDLAKNDFDIINQIGKAGGFIDTYKCDDEDIIYSPIYMEENPQKVLEVLNQYNDDEVKKALELLEAKPGLPVKKLDNIKSDVLLGLMSSNVLHTPAIKASGGQVNFIFTPFTEVEDKEMLRQARNVVSAVRYGEKFSRYSELKNPYLFLQKLLERGYIGKTPHSDIEAQYGVLRDNGLGWIEEVGTGRYRFHLADTLYAKNVVILAQKILFSQHPIDLSMERGIIKEAWEERELLSGYQFSQYIPNLSNLRSIQDLKNKRKIEKNSDTINIINKTLNKLFISGGEPDVF